MSAKGMPVAASPSLRSTLDYEPQVLKFGTSGRRGDVIHLTQLEIYVNASAELEYLQSLPATEGGIRRGDEFYFAYDLRPSSTRFVPEQGGRGEIAQAIERAIRDAGLKPVNLGAIPTPALTSFALERGRGSIMITGSHIPFDRNGYKTNSAKGELLKKDEAPINARVEQVRQRVYEQPAAESPFDRHGSLKGGPQALSPERGEAREAYVRRYVDFFGAGSLEGLRLLVYQHSAVGRDLLVEVVERLGAKAVPAGRSETFVPIDTEAIDAAQLKVIQDLAAAAWAERGGPLDAVVSTDGDSDRPLLLAIEPTGAMSCKGVPCRVRFFGGDLVGMVVAEHLRADAVVVPISCNDAVDRGALGAIVEPKTRIGSPFVIAGMEAARAKGRKAVCGWEANGGFLTGSDVTLGGKTLRALPTRDAVLPLVSALAAAKSKGLTLSGLFDGLPRRFSRAALLRKFPRPVSLRIVERFSPGDPAVSDIVFTDSGVSLRDAAGKELPPTESARTLEAIRESLAEFFSPALGFGRVARVNYTDGVRIYFDNGDVAHVRPSGNADELRIYAVADTQDRADAITAAGVAEPDGILRRMEKAVSGGAGAAARDSGTGGPPVPQDSDAGAAVERFKAKPVPLPLTGKVQHYDWGGFDFIPALVGMDNAARRPCAEFWIGGHPGGCAVAQVGDARVSLAQLAHGAPAALLGPEAASRFGGRLPYLLKILDARKMLSIQAHPTIPQAKEGYDREEAAGIPLGAPNRNYKDRNHKPEIHVGLSEFWMLHGFRPLEEIAAALSSVPEFAGLLPDFAQRLSKAGRDEAARSNLLRELYHRVMTMPQEAVDATLKPLVTRLKARGAADKDSPDFWAARAADDFPLPGGHVDRGIFSIYLLNLVRLRPGQATFQPAGTLHAYLEGANVELMADSDNVLRGGLTPKHMDVPELMRILDFTSGRPDVLEGEALPSGETVYHTPADEFELSSIRLAPGAAYAGAAENGPDTLIAIEGNATLRWGDDSRALRRGEAILVPCGMRYTVKATEGAALLFRAAVPTKS